uniref:Neuromedin-S n=1 Tax=Cairina moschata TaxID=8855 RepID=A0A8C3GMX5_CAIMO
MSPPPSPSPPPALPWLLAACCLCALPRGSGFPQPFARYRDGAELPKSQQLALCFSQWMELSHQPQISSTVLDLCYSIFNSMHTNEESQIATAEFTKKVCKCNDKRVAVDSGVWPFLCFFCCFLQVIFFLVVGKKAVQTLFLQRNAPCIKLSFLHFLKSVNL